MVTLRSSSIFWPGADGDDDDVVSHQMMKHSIVMTAAVDEVADDV